MKYVRENISISLAMPQVLRQSCSLASLENHKGGSVALAICFGVHHLAEGNAGVFDSLLVKTRKRELVRILDIRVHCSNDLPSCYITSEVDDVS